MLSGGYNVEDFQVQDVHILSIGGDALSQIPVIHSTGSVPTYLGTLLKFTQLLSRAPWRCSPTV
jgi:hypothetical protein